MDSASSILGALYARLPVIGTVVVGALLSGLWFAGQRPAEYVATASLMVPTEAPTMSINTEAGNVPRGIQVPDKGEDLRIGLIGVVASGAVHERVYHRLRAEGWENLNYNGLKRNIIGDISRTSRLLILAYARSKERAATLANVFLEELEVELEELASVGPRRTLEALEIEEPRAWADYEAAQEDLVEFLDGLGSTGVAVDLAELLGERRRIENALFELEVRDSVARAERPVLERLLAGLLEEGETPFIESSRSIVRSPAFLKAEADVKTAAFELAMARTEFHDAHPEIGRLQARLATVEEAMREVAAEEFVEGTKTMTLDEQARMLAQKLIEADIATASFEPQREVLGARLDSLKTTLAAYPGYTSRETALRDRAALLKNYAERLSSRQMELKFHLERGITFTITDDIYRAQPERSKPVPSTGGILAFSLVGGLMVGILLALMLELIAKLRLNALY